MSEPSRLVEANRLLQAAYGQPDLSSNEAGWSRFLHVLLGIAADHPLRQNLNEVLRSPPLATPGESSAATTGQLVEILAPFPRGSQKASLIRAVAAWWVSTFGNEVSPEWTVGVQTYRDALRSIRGLGPATVDELLLFAANLPVFPVDRSALRVAVRHGWLDLPVEDEEAQSLFVSGLNRSSPDLQEFSRVISLVGERHCGREPLCDGCPLQSMLPEGGPRNPQSC
jgi:endonuclease-3 related protein